MGSGFGAHTTAAEVLAGHDLSGRTALVTGGYSGIGTEIVRALVGAGATVLVPARRPEAAAEVLAGIDRVTVDELDLSDQGSVASYCDRVLAEGTTIDLVFANAAVMAVPEQRTAEGWELHLATNHLGHFALVNRLWPLLADGGRVVVTASGGHHYTPMRWDDPHFGTGYDKFLGYGQSKTANVLFALELDRLGASRGIHAYSLHPGAILTDLGRHLAPTDADALLNSHDDGLPLELDFKSPAAGAATPVWAAVEPRLADRGGAYLQDCEVAPLVEITDRDGGGVKAYAIDPVEAARLWAWSAELTGVDIGGLDGRYATARPASTVTSLRITTEGGG